MAVRIINALSVDVEDYFHVSAFEKVVRREDWDTFSLRVGPNTDRCLELLSRHGVKATFFVLGWVAERQRDLVKRIAAAGHEVASHGYSHQLIYNQSPAEFAGEIGDTKKMLEDIVGQPVLGYRAPSYSITQRSLWALDELIDAGYRYDSSIFPVHHDRYGIPDAPRFPHRIDRPGKGSIAEFPLTTLRLGPLNIPVAGGGYLRILPPLIIRMGFRKANREGHPAILYFHPWEIDPGQPRLKAGRLSTFRHYHNLKKTEKRIEGLLTRFAFAPVKEVLAANGLL